MDSYKSIYGCLLLELTITEVQSRKTSKKFVRAAEADMARSEERASRLPATSEERERWAMSQPEIAMEELTKLIPRDIQEQSKGNALNWLTSLYIKGALVVNRAKVRHTPVGEYSMEVVAIKGFGCYEGYGHALIGRSNSERISSALETFYQAKEQNLTHFLTIKSIEQMPDILTLLTVAEEAESQIQKHNDDKIENARHGAYDTLVYEDDQWSMYLPKTKGDTCALGRGTKWCTAAPGLDYYSEYVHGIGKEGAWYARRFNLGPQKLFIIISKTDKNEKYQLWFGFNQSEDEYYEEVGEWGPERPEATIDFLLKQIRKEGKLGNMYQLGQFMDKKDAPMPKSLQYKFMSIIEDKLYDQLGVVEEAVFEAVQETYSIIDNKLYSRSDEGEFDGVFVGEVRVRSMDSTPENSGLSITVKKDREDGDRGINHIWVRCTNYKEQPDHLEIRRFRYRTQERVKELTSDTPIDLNSVMFYTDEDVDGEYIYNIQNNEHYGVLRGYQIHKEMNALHGEGSGAAILDWDSDADTISYKTDNPDGMPELDDDGELTTPWSKHIPTDEAIAKGLLDKHPLEYLKDTPLHTTIGKLPDNLSFDTEAVSKLL